MEQSIPDYEPISLRGSGAFGYVIEAYDRVHDARVAIKRTHKVGQKLSREYEILSKLKDCEYVVKMMDTFYSVNDDGKVIQNLIFEYVSRSLEGYMESIKIQKKLIPIEKIKTLSKQLLLGLKYCHSKNIVHRDLKPENVLLTEDERIKICDFGSSKLITDKTTSTPYIVSRYYRAPELILGYENYDEKIDIFAAGCILAELFTLTPLFAGKTEGLQLFEYMCVIGHPGSEYFTQFKLPQNSKNYLMTMEKIPPAPLEKILNSEGFYNNADIKNASDLILKMISWNFKERLTAAQCLEHPFFK